MDMPTHTQPRDGHPYTHTTKGRTSRHTHTHPRGGHADTHTHTQRVDMPTHTRPRDRTDWAHRSRFEYGPTVYAVTPSSPSKTAQVMPPTQPSLGVAPKRIRSPKPIHCERTMGPAEMERSWSHPSWVPERREGIERTFKNTGMDIPVHTASRLRSSLPSRSRNHHKNHIDTLTRRQRAQRDVMYGARLGTHTSTPCLKSRSPTQQLQTRANLALAHADIASSTGLDRLQLRHQQARPTPGGGGEVLDRPSIHQSQLDYSRKVAARADPIAHMPRFSVKGLVMSMGWRVVSGALKKRFQLLSERLIENCRMRQAWAASEDRREQRLDDPMEEEDRVRLLTDQLATISNDHEASGSGHPTTIRETPIDGCSIQRGVTWDHRSEAPAVGDLQERQPPSAILLPYMRRFRETVSDH
ncbi:MAG: hypothetical protein LQ350_005065 [Teloschistes chrysophthalmus]|nr:MAG: hypothetical protein LQ350_005065 [Niorma chrysophthalma]